MFISIIFAIVLGLVVGVAVNALADDLPLRRSPRLPRYVPMNKKMAVHFRPTEENPEPPVDMQEDDEKRPFIAWLGITAFLFGKRESSDGTIKLSWRYPIVEIFTAILMVLAVVAIQDIVAQDTNPTKMSVIQAIYWLIYMGIFSLIIVIDIEHKLILFVVIIPSSLLAISDALLTEVSISSSLDLAMHQPQLKNSLIGGAVGFIVFFIMYNGGFLFTYVMGILRGQKIEEVAFGYGDVMMAMLSGLILGWEPLLVAMFITVFLGAFGAIVYMTSRLFLGQKYSAYTALPYGPYIVIGTLIMLLYRSQVSEILLDGGAVVF